MRNSLEIQNCQLPYRYIYFELYNYQEDIVIYKCRLFQGDSHIELSTSFEKYSYRIVNFPQGIFMKNIFFPGGILIYYCHLPNGKYSQSIVNLFWAIFICNFYLPWLNYSYKKSKVPQCNNNNEKCKLPWGHIHIKLLLAHEKQSRHIKLPTSLQVYLF